MSIQLGIIGFGYMGKWHLNNAPRVEGVKVVAAYDIDAARVAAAREAGLRGYDKLDDFLRDEEINLVLVATPNDSHCELVCAALAAGKHVISEKPPAMSLAELDKMIATAEAHRQGRAGIGRTRQCVRRPLHAARRARRDVRLARGTGARWRHDLRLGRAFCRPAFKLVWL